ncbi:Fic family protein [Rhizobium rhizogenes]|uniref:Fic family protein n=1 Tax=Rhizobium rhizogenes TaxID=359 RepID=UPI0015726085|nr:Fic family protein [Rhizobium rhizogenes]NTI24198.1 Fic family protein [Rhizobium rhizogenes]QTG04025.1 Fic family protein [Rhizobium rhizogenes]
MLNPSYQLPDLTSLDGLETIEVFKALAAANRSLAELKGRAAAIPNQGILIDTLALQEAKASSEIENIVTTQDELFQADLFPEGLESPAAKEVALYRDALKFGFDKLRQTEGLITNATIVGMFQLLKRRTDGFRQTPGTALRNDRSGEIVYVPPQDQNEINSAMSRLERFINDDQLSTLDPLIKMALIHHQFESIHPFPDGNGRIGRILNVLYLTRVDLLEIPILYLSRAINTSKSEYYRLLQHVRDTGEWEDWLIYMLRAVDETAKTTLNLVENIRTQMASMKKRLRTEFPKIYSQDLLNNLFRHPYTRIDYVQKELNVTRQTAARYLDTLADARVLSKHQSGRNNYYINEPLIALFLKVSE